MKTEAASIERPFQLKFRETVLIVLKEVLHIIRRILGGKFLASNARLNGYSAQSGTSSPLDHSSLLQNYGSAILSEVRIAILNNEYRFIWMNEKFCNHFSHKTQDLINKRIDGLKCINHDTTFFKEVFSTISRGYTWTGEINVRRNDARLSWIKTTIIPVRKGSDDAYSYIVFNSDITRTKNALEEKKIAVEKLFLSEARYRVLVENQPDIVCLCKSDGSLIYGNNSFCAFTGKKLCEIYGVDIRQLLLQDQKETDINNIFSLNPRHPEITAVFEFLDYSRKKLWCSITAKALFDPHGNVMEILLVGRDISEIKNAEIKKQLYTQDLERIAFLTSHNVRSPIATMLGLIELLKMNAIDSAEWDKTLSHFKTCVRNLDSCTRELSAFVSERQSSVDL